MATLSAPEDAGKSQNVVKMLQLRSSFTHEDAIYQEQELETIKAIIGQFLTNEIEREIHWQEPEEDEFFPFEDTELIN